MTEELQTFYSDENPWVLLRFRELLHYLLVPVMLLLVVVLYLEFFGHVGHTVHQRLVLAERLILAYFVAEVGADFILFESKTEFLREKWFDILLILPFLAVFRSVGRLGKMAKGVRTLKSIKVLQLGEVPVAAGLVASEGSAGLRLAKLGKYVPKFQKLMHLFREVPKFYTYVPNAQSVVYLVTQAKQYGGRLLQFLVPVGAVALVSTRLKPDQGDDEGDGENP